MTALPQVGPSKATSQLLMDWLRPIWLSHSSTPSSAQSYFFTHPAYIEGKDNLQHYSRLGQSCMRVSLAKPAFQGTWANTVSTKIDLMRQSLRIFWRLADNKDLITANR